MHATEFAKQHPEKHASWARRWQQNNKAKRSSTATAYVAKRKNVDPAFRVRVEFTAAIATALKRNGFKKRSRANAILGCSWPEFVRHIELQFLAGMTWANRALWHIDHITPLATAKTDADVLALNHFTNLRPLWAVDNLEKRANITHLI